MEVDAGVDAVKSRVKARKLTANPVRGKNFIGGIVGTSLETGFDDGALPWGLVGFDC